MVNVSPVEVPRISLANGDEFARRFEMNLAPVVISDDSRNWPAAQKWDSDYLRNKIGTHHIKVGDLECSFNEFMDIVENSTTENPAPYLKEVSISGEFPELLPDLFPSMHCVQRNRLTHPMMSDHIIGKHGRSHGYPELLVGSVGGQFPGLHYDVYHMNACVTQIVGDKEFMLFPPDQSRYLYIDSDRSNFSNIPNAFSVDLEQYPLFAEAECHRVIVNPGETIFVPAGWWHVTRMLNTSIAVSFSTVTRSNWNSFLSDIEQEMLEYSSPIKTKIKIGYARMIGLFSNVADIYRMA